MKILLIYYTGTYNTRFLTDAVYEKLTKKGHSVDRVEINRQTPPADTGGYDLIGLGYPIYGFNSPLPFNRYLQKLQFTKGQKYFIYKNSGETFAMNNASSRIILRRLKRKMTFAGEYHFAMPYNIHFAFERAFIREILDKNDKLLDIMTHDLENGNAPKIRSNPMYNIAAAFVSIQKMGGNVNSFLYRVDADKCVKCGICVRDCPENNIRVSGDKIKFGHRCDMCMRCSFFCPTNAIKIGFLEGWKVNGDYGLKKIAEDKSPRTPYITADSRGFYKCFIKYFASIDARYKELFGTDGKQVNTAEEDAVDFRQSAAQDRVQSP